MKMEVGEEGAARRAPRNDFGDRPFVMRSHVFEKAVYFTAIPMLKDSLTVKSKFEYIAYGGTLLCTISLKPVEPH